MILTLAGQLRDAFREIDSDNNGSICVNELKMVVKKEGEACTSMLPITTDGERRERELYVGGACRSWLMDQARSFFRFVENDLIACVARRQRPQAVGPEKWDP